MAEADTAAPRNVLADRWARLASHERVVAVGVAAIGVMLVLHGINSATVDGRFLHVDMEQNLPTWARSLLYAAAAVACLVTARHGASDRRTWLALGLFMAAFSLDDVVMGHEWLESQGEGHALITIWEPLAAVAVLWVFSAAFRRLGSPQRGLILLAGVALVLGQACSSLGDRVDAHSAIVALSCLEQSFEAMVGIFVLAAAWEPARAAVRRWAYASAASLS
jgi:hypothetical protein